MCAYKEQHDFPDIVRLSDNYLVSHSIPFSSTAGCCRSLSAAGHRRAGKVGVC